MPENLPQYVRKHHDGFRCVITIDGTRKYGATRNDPDEAHREALSIIANPKQPESTLPKYVRRHGTGFRYVLTLYGKRVRSETFRDAQECGKAALARVSAIRSRTEMALPMNATVRDAVGFFLVNRANVLARGSIEMYRSHLGNVLRHSGWTDLPISRLDPSRVRAWVETRQGSIKKATFWGKEFRILRTMCRWLHQRGLIPLDPTNEIELPRASKSDAKRFGYLKPETVWSIIERMRGYRDSPGRRPLRAGRDADLVTVFFLTGLRRSEAERLRWTDIDFEAGTMLIRGKMGERIIPVHPGVVGPLDRLRQESRRVFKTPKAAKKPRLAGEFLPATAATNAIFGCWSRRLKIDVFHAHALRHSFITSAINSGASVPTVAAWAGHSIQQMQTYFHQASDANHEQFARIGRSAESKPNLRILMDDA